MRPKTKVVGGKNSAFGAWPWQVLCVCPAWLSFGQTPLNQLTDLFICLLSRCPLGEHIFLVSRALIDVEVLC